LEIAMRRTASLLALLCITATLCADDVESRRLTHYLPQDFLEESVRKDGWTEVPLPLKGGVQKADTLRIWAGGSIDRGNGEPPGKNASGPAGVFPKEMDVSRLSLSPKSEHAYALLFKTSKCGPVRCAAPGQALEIRLSEDNEKLYLGFNDERGAFHDNHIGRGARHALDPLWVRVEVVRIIVD
jgi:hypothetical protein